jgi:predicted nucleotide-binding protein
MPKQKPVVFLGCSTEATEFIAPAIQDDLNRYALVQMWNQGFFRPGRYILEELTDQAKRFDFALLLFAADDIVII